MHILGLSDLLKVTFGQLWTEQLIEHWWLLGEVDPSPLGCPSWSQHLLRWDDLPFGNIFSCCRLL